MENLKISLNVLVSAIEVRSFISVYSQNKMFKIKKYNFYHRTNKKLVFIECFYLYIFLPFTKRSHFNVCNIKVTLQLQQDKH